MWFFRTVFVSVFAVLPVVLAYNTNRRIFLVDAGNTCQYYENPNFRLQNRMGNDAPEVILIDNRVQKDSYYPHKKFMNPNLVQDSLVYFEKLPPMSIGQLDQNDFGLTSVEEKENEDEEVAIDYDKLWKVGEIPQIKAVQALPDVYMSPEDAPPILDMMTKETSELTEETHDMEDVEFEERTRKDPATQVQEVYIEKIMPRSESILSTANPSLLMFKEIELPKAKSENIMQIPRKAIQEEKALEDGVTQTKQKIIEKILDNSQNLTLPSV